MKIMPFRRIARTAAVLALLGPLVATGAHSRDLGTAQEPAFIPYVMEHGYFSCDIPTGWDLSRDPEKDAEYKIFEIALNGPEGFTTIDVSYMLKDNEDFSGYRDFLDRNSRNVLGETDNAREHYGPVTKTTLDGKPALALKRDRMTYLHPESTSDESVRLIEDLTVLPMKDGSFYVLHYTAEADAYEEFRPVFERVVRSFRARAI